MTHGRMLGCGNTVAVPGLPGPPGFDGDPVQLRVDAGWIQWKYQSDADWLNLISTASLAGPTGPQGAAGTPGAAGAAGLSVELQTTATHVQWRQAGGSWADLIALSTLTGATGATGAQGVGITGIALTAGSHAPGTLDTYTITYSDTSTAVYTVYNGADGATGATGATGPTGPAGPTTWAGITDKPSVIAAGVDAAAARTAIAAVHTLDSRLSDPRVPSGGAGGVLSGIYPNPGFAVDMATQVGLDSLAGIVATKEPNIAAGTTAQYWRGDKSWQALDKSAVGLSAADNTSDINKPVSAATAIAIEEAVILQSYLTMGA